VATSYDLDLAKAELDESNDPDVVLGLIRGVAGTDFVTQFRVSGYLSYAAEAAIRFAEAAVDKVTLNGCGRYGTHHRLALRDLVLQVQDAMRQVYSVLVGVLVSNDPQVLLLLKGTEQVPASLRLWCDFWREMFRLCSVRIAVTVSTLERVLEVAPRLQTVQGFLHVLHRLNENRAIRNEAYDSQYADMTSRVSSYQATKKNKAARLGFRVMRE
jgi:hypothetical protein